MPEAFLPVAGGWGKSGATHVVLKKANEDLLAGALRMAWKLRLDKNAQTSRGRTAPKKASAMPAKKAASAPAKRRRKPADS
jgi:hypothetical protein